MSSFRHVLMIRFKDEASEEQIDALFAGLSQMPGEIPLIRRYEFGRDLALGDRSYHMALVADFDSEEDWRAYSSHPFHLEFVEDRLRPVLAQAVRVQYLVA